MFNYFYSFANAQKINGNYLSLIVFWREYYFPLPPFPPPPPAWNAAAMKKMVARKAFADIFSETNKVKFITLQKDNALKMTDLRTFRRIILNWLQWANVYFQFVEIFCHCRIQVGFCFCTKYSAAWLNGHRLCRHFLTIKGVPCIQHAIRQIFQLLGNEKLRMTKVAI